MTENRPLDTTSLLASLQCGPFADSAQALLSAINQTVFSHGDAPRWATALSNLPPLDVTPQLDQDCVHADFSAGQNDLEAIDAALRELQPWRKGPFAFGPIHVDTEWHSDWKWQRIAPALESLGGRRVLDVGGGNGYFSLRCVGAGATAVLNVDPTLLFYAQYLAAQHFLRAENVNMLPATFEALPELPAFDTALSMGILYHRRSPLDHLTALRRRLRQGGQLVLETLVVAGDETTVLVPEGRYARMRNVYFLPSVDALCSWLRKSGFSNVRVVDVTVTTPDEQRTTEWMPFESLAQSLHPQDSTRTLEDLPAPLRAVLVAEA